ncbi:HlyC/CorC family transporter [Campylobacter sp. RM9344]|uniref:HlyC/CorC family transporter n=2 Tax=Campylobacteraceae TaxID=72294 RepID=A0AAW3ZVD6_9BACT|nr:MULTISPECIES: hemolysin family protein [unclassified Campylobacter]MBE2984019.1 HlyC/CorC family transporter [Campylobacter sp. RM6883]MBE2987064.1 HlyC/CorC family transporter [Campylobacter sp. RM12919]MBE2988962.1 HlyC/CorC family transporter [Campylobacter sp. RM12920]MBE2995444.1 HlyC/CorC family transporter [Campylobacter sp. RM6913]MBE3030240.1 HlyC/CorC family transporter [Campylobacter sp. RM9344]
MHPSSDSSLLMIFLAVVFILLNAFFVLSEFSLVKIRKTRLEELIKEKTPNAQLAFDMSNQLDTYLSATQLGITLSSLALGWIGEPAVARVIEGPLKKYLDMSDLLISTVGFAIAFTIITLLHVVVGELIPKSIAIAKAEVSVLRIAKPLHVFWVIFSPVIKTFDALAILGLKILGIKPAKENDLAHSEEEIKIIVGESLKGGVLDSFETEIIKNAVDFSDTVAKEIMTPRRDMVCINKQRGFEENLKIVFDSKYTRYPYIDGSKDVVLGMIHIRDILEIHFGDKERNFDGIVREFLIVPESLSISKVILLMNKEQKSAALVVDEYGGTSGILTMEDIMEEVLGDMNDEHDDASEQYKKINDDIYEFSGRFELESIEEMFGITFDEATEQVTIGGYVFNLIGRLPVVGDRTEDENFFYEVRKMDGTSILRVKIRRKT